MFRPHGGHLQAYKIRYHTRYICWYCLRYPVVYSTLVIKMWYIKIVIKMSVKIVWIDIYMYVRGICVRTDCAVLCWCYGRGADRDVNRAKVRRGWALAM